MMSVKISRLDLNAGSKQLLVVSVTSRDVMYQRCVTSVVVRLADVSGGLIVRTEKAHVPPADRR